MNRIVDGVQWVNSALDTYKRKHVSNNSPYARFIRLKPDHQEFIVMQNLERGVTIEYLQNIVGLGDKVIGEIVRRLRARKYILPLLKKPADFSTKIIIGRYEDLYFKFRHGKETQDFKKSLDTLTQLTSTLERMGEFKGTGTGTLTDFIKTIREESEKKLHTDIEKTEEEASVAN